MAVKVAVVLFALTVACFAASNRQKIIKLPQIELDPSQSTPSMNASHRSDPKTRYTGSIWCYSGQAPVGALVAFLTPISCPYSTADGWCSISQVGNTYLYGCGSSSCSCYGWQVFVPSEYYCCDQDYCNKSISPWNNLYCDSVMTTPRHIPMPTRYNSAAGHRPLFRVSIVLSSIWFILKLTVI